MVSAIKQEGRLLSKMLVILMTQHEFNIETIIQDYVI